MLRENWSYLHHHDRKHRYAVQRKDTVDKANQSLNSTCCLLANRSSRYAEGRCSEVDMYVKFEGVKEREEGGKSEEEKETDRNVQVTAGL